MLKYLIFEHKNTLVREQHLINTSVCLSGILLTYVFFYKSTQVFLFLHLRVTEISKFLYTY